jgi:hypothetical protein
VARRLRALFSVAESSAHATITTGLRGLDLDMPPSTWSNEPADHVLAGMQVLYGEDQRSLVERTFRCLP